MGNKDESTVHVNSDVLHICDKILQNMNAIDVNSTVHCEINVSSIFVGNGNNRNITDIYMIQQQQRRH